MKSSAFCKELNEQRCPCYLALINECTYCTLLQGDEVCNCNWSGDCALHYFPWNNNENFQYADNTIIGTIPYPYACGIIIKSNNELAIGTQLTIHYPELKQRLSAVVFASYPQHNLLYAISFDAFPFRLLENKQLDVSPGNNVFDGSSLLTSSGKNILLACDKHLHKAVMPLKIALIKSGNIVTLQDIDSVININAPDILVFIGKESKLRKATQLINNINTKFVVWIT